MKYFRFFVVILAQRFENEQCCQLNLVQKRAIYCQCPGFIAFLYGNELAKNRQMAKIGDFDHLAGLQNRGIGDLSRELATLSITELRTSSFVM